MASKLKTTNIEFNPETLHHVKADSEFKRLFKHLIKELNREVESSLFFKKEWKLDATHICLQDTPNLIYFVDFANAIAEYNYPKHDIKFIIQHCVVSHSGHVVVRLKNKLKSPEIYYGN